MLRETIRALTLGGLVACAQGGEIDKKDPARFDSSDMALYMGRVADARACVMERFVKIEKTAGDETFSPSVLETGFAGIPKDKDVRDMINVQMSWYLNGETVKNTLRGEGEFDLEAFFTELGANLKSRTRPELEATYRANWDKRCPGREASDDFYRSVYFVGPAYGITGVGLCLGNEHRCGDF